jgi:2-amino-4-hydroxy-6-hydroxymethyldihydropteridine diphosphokinase
MNVPKTRRAYLGLGSNLGDRLAHLQRAIDALAARDDVALLAVSPVYETEPVGGPEQAEYLNAVVELETALGARELLGIGQRLEADARRVRTERWGPRTLDVDVLLVGDEQVHEPDLDVPHPRMWERDFVLAPLADLAPDLVARGRPAPDPTTGWVGVRRTDLTLVLP